MSGHDLHAHDAMSAAPDHHDVLMENDRVRVLDTRLGPGERTPVHTHQWPAVLYILSWSDFIRYDPEGNVIADSRTMAMNPAVGSSLWSGPLVPHYVHNVGDRALHVIAVEMKDAGESALAPATRSASMPLADVVGAPADFDFIIGEWTVQHRRLDSRLSGCTAWTEFEGRSATRKILGGNGNVEDNILGFPEGEVRASAFRSFDPQSRTWSIWWLDGRNPHRLDPPVIGAFAGTTGTFFADDVLGGTPIRVRFIWRANPGGHPTWEQAFSDDGGTTWETNWTMEFRRRGA